MFLLRDVDKRRDNIIRLGTMLMINLGLERDYETVTVRKAMKPVPAYNVALFSYPGQAPVGEYYLKKKFQGIPICVGDRFVGTTLPYSDSRWIIFAIKSVGSKVEYERNFGSVYMITSETSFEEIISEGEEEKD